MLAQKAQLTVSALSHAVLLSVALSYQPLKTCPCYMCFSGSTMLACPCLSVVPFVRMYSPIRHIPHELFPSAWFMI